MYQYTLIVDVQKDPKVRTGDERYQFKTFSKETEVEQQKAYQAEVR